MSVSRDPDKKPTVSPQLHEYAVMQNKQIVSVAVFDGDVDDPDTESMNFVCATPFIPRIGESIRLENGVLVKVLDIEYRVVTSGDVVMLWPNLLAQTEN